MQLLKFLLCCIVLVTSLSCSRKSISSLERKGVDVTQKHTEIRVGEGGGKVDIQYLGCGGLYIRHEGIAIVTDPFFSNQRIFTLAKSTLFGGRVHSKPRYINFAKQRVLDSLKITEPILQQETKAIFVSHGHYDHLMDVPYVFSNWFNHQPDIYVNQSSFNTCVNAIKKPDKLHNAEAIMSVRNQLGASVDFHTREGSVVKVYPMRADHNPHALNIKFYSGAVMCPLPYFKNPESKTHANDWLEGRTLSFLVDIEQRDSILFRMFIQSSSAHFPEGLPPVSLLQRRPVDLAVLGVASYHFSEKSYPCDYLEAMRAKKAVFIHWEDFFRNYKRKPKTVLATDVPRFFKSILPACVTSKPEYSMPAPGVVTTVHY